MQDSKRNAAGPVKEEEGGGGEVEEGHKLNYRSIKGDNKNLLHFDHHEIIVRHSLSLHTPMQSRRDCRQTPERPLDRRKVNEK